MGTYYRVIYAKRKGCAVDLAAVEGRLQGLNAALSTYLADSEISRFNRYDKLSPVHISNDFKAVLTIAQNVHTMSGGAFDVTVGPLVEVWGFGAPQVDRPPSVAAQSRAAERVGMDKLTLKDNLLSKRRVDIALDLSAVAKGYAVDALAALLGELGCTDYMVDIGGEIQVRGNNSQGDSWRIGIETPSPSPSGLQARLALHAGGVATSGDYRNYVVVDGARVDHILDPRTGQPARSPVVSATVVHTQTAVADAYATALMVLDVDEGLALAERAKLAVYLIFADPGGALQVRYNAAMGNYLLPEL